jgi:protein-export membrane protein SecD
MSAEKRRNNWILVIVVLVLALSVPVLKARNGEDIIKQGLDIAGGVDLLLEAQFNDDVEENTSDIIQGAIYILRNRLDPEGVKEVVIQNLGEDRIVVQVPGEDDPEKIIELIGTTATLRFIDVGNDPLADGTYVRFTDPATGSPIDIGLGLDYGDGGTPLSDAVTTTVVPGEDETINLILDNQVFLQSEDLASFSMNTAVEGGTPVPVLNIIDDPTKRTEFTGRVATGSGKTLGLVINNVVRANYTITDDPLNGGYIPFPELAEEAGFSIDSLNTGIGGAIVVDFAEDPLAVGDLIELYNPMGGAQGEETQAPAETTTTGRQRVDILYDKVILTGDDFADAYVQFSQVGKPIIGFEFKPEGARIFGDHTAKHVGQYLCITLDDKVISCPRINSAILGGRGVIEGSFTPQEAQDLVIKLDSGRLPVPLKVIENRTVDPTLGAKSIEDSKHAAVLGIILILLFMIAYYRMPGLMADLALLYYGALFLGALSLLSATLTLPGIAGFILSLGMAVDANIIIFERLKEELKTGKTFRSAVDAAFKRAFLAIFDANVTTLITGLVLYNLGTGPIKGFAVTLCLGIVVSMFSALVFTRLLLESALQSKSMHKYSLFGVSEKEVAASSKGGGVR